MDEDKKVLISGITVSTIIMIFAITFAAYGGVSKMDGLLYGGIIAIVVAAVICICQIIWYVRKKKREMRELAEKYNDALKDVGYVTFLDQGIKFAAEGKFACVKDFNGKKGYHFAFQITATKLVYKPENYDDVLDYENTLFIIELAYYDGEKLYYEYNDNGIILDDISDLKGKTIKIEQNKGYVAQIASVEWDDIDRGEITFEEWDDEKHIISFMLLAAYGVGDVIVGKVELSPDND